MRGPDHDTTGTGLWRRPDSRLPRRALVSRYGALGAGAALALAARLPLPAAPASPSVDDGEALAWLLGLENQLRDYYDRALAAFDDAAFEAAGFGPRVRGALVDFAEQERRHAELVSRLVGDGHGPRPPDWSSAEILVPEDAMEVVSTAASAENAIRDAYARAAVTIRDARVLGDLIGLLSAEARHSGFLSGLVGWPVPVPEAIDTVAPLRPDELVGLGRGGGVLGSAAGQATPVEITTGPSYPESVLMASPPAAGTATPASPCRRVGRARGPA